MSTWPQTPIGDLCLPSDQRDPRTAPAVPFKYVDIASVDRDRKVVQAATEMLGSEAPSRARKAIEADDVLVSTVRPNLNAVAMVTGELHNNIASTGFCVLRADKTRLLPRFLYYWTRSPIFIEHLTARMTGASYPAVTDAVVRNAPIPTPPLAEQQRLVRLLDESDGVRHLRSAADERTDALIPAMYHEMFGDPATNPKGLLCQPLGDLCDVQGGGTPSKARPEFWQGDIPWVSPKDMGTLTVSDSQDHITSEAIAQSATNLLPVGAVLMVTRSGILKHTLPLAVTVRPVAINQDIKAFIPKEGLDSVFLLIQLRNRAAEILGKVRTGATVQNLETAAVKSLPIIVPPLEQQQVFASRAQEVWSLQERQAKSRQRLDDLFQSLLHRAFQGTL